MSVPSDAGIAAFLDAHPRTARRAAPGGAMHIRGRFDFAAEHSAAGVIADAFELCIVIPNAFPAAVPQVTELGGRIPRDGEYHVNPSDSTLCLGSPMGLLLKISEAPSLLGFAESCLVRYLYAVSHKLAHGGPFLFGELAHGTPGVLADYLGIFRLTEPAQVLAALRLLGMEKRRANKQPCPCGCRRLLGRCRLNHRLASFRRLAGRPWFRRQAAELGAL